MLKKRQFRLAVPRLPDAARQCPFGFAPCLPGPERLVALGFRYWMQGRLDGTVTHWERAWNLYSGCLGVAGARVAVSSLSRWVGSVGSTCARKIEVYPAECGSFCRDECIAVSMIAACQHQTCPALRACAFALVETSIIDGVVDEAQAFADAMAGLDQILSPQSIVTAPVSFSSAGQVLQ